MTEPPPAAMRWGSGLNRVPHAGEVDADGLLPGGVVEFESGDGLVDARVRHRDVQPAEFGDAVVQCGPQRRGVPHARLARHDPPVQSLDLADHLDQVLLGGCHGDVIPRRSAPIARLVAKGVLLCFDDDENGWLLPSPI
jgi:hypothetical protein